MSPSQREAVRCFVILLACSSFLFVCFLGRGEGLCVGGGGGAVYHSLPANQHLLIALNMKIENKNN